jgi:uncharacterized membrane protein
MQLNQTLGTLNRIHAGRWASLFGGGALLSLGIARRSRLSWMLMPVGAGLVFQAARASMHSSAGPSVSVPFHKGVCVEKSVTIDKSPEELYRTWDKLENLPRVMKRLESVNVIDDLHSHWVMRAPAGQILQWDAEIVNDIPDRLIGWRSLPGADIAHAGSIHFDPAPGGRGTMVKVEIEYEPPVGRIGDAVGKLAGQDVGRLVQENLLRFKEWAETGQVITIE